MFWRALHSEGMVPFSKLSSSDLKTKVFSLLVSRHKEECGFLQTSQIRQRRPLLRKILTQLVVPSVSITKNREEMKENEKSENKKGNNTKSATGQASRIQNAVLQLADCRIRHYGKKMIHENDKNK
jgi:hypothetical protein